MGPVAPSTKGARLKGWSLMRRHDGGPRAYPSLASTKKPERVKRRMRRPSTFERTCIDEVEYVVPYRRRKREVSIFARLTSAHSAVVMLLRRALLRTCGGGKRRQRWEATAGSSSGWSIFDASATKAASFAQSAVVCSVMFGRRCTAAVVCSLVMFDRRCSAKGMVLNEKTRRRTEGIPIVVLDFGVNKEARMSQEAHETTEVVGFCLVDSEGVNQLFKRDGSTMSMNHVGNA
nr:hypothetical protein Iba_scaffold7598CG0010 [Ipomoea batatas]